MTFVKDSQANDIVKSRDVRDYCEFCVLVTGEGVQPLSVEIHQRKGITVDKSSNPYDKVSYS
jgi:hypothetical protein